MPFWPNSISPGSETDLPAETPPEKVSVSLEEVIPVLAQSFCQGRQWVSDFGQDQIQIPKDLFEAIQVARHIDPATAKP